MRSYSQQRGWNPNSWSCMQSSTPQGYSCQNPSSWLLCWDSPARDLIRVHKVREQPNGHHNVPYAQRLDLWWVLVSSVSLDGAHRSTASTFKTTILENGHPSFFRPRESRISVKETTIGKQKVPDLFPIVHTSFGELVSCHSEDDYRLAPRFSFSSWTGSSSKMSKTVELLGFLSPLQDSSCQTTKSRPSVDSCL